MAREPRWQLLLVIHWEKEEAEEEEEEEDETVAPLLLLPCLLVLPSSSASWVMVFGVRGLASPHSILGAMAWVSCLRRAHDVTMLEFFNVPSMYEAILAILSCLLRGHTVSIVMLSGDCVSLMAVRVFNVPAVLEAVPAMLSVCFWTHNGLHNGHWRRCVTHSSTTTDLSVC